MEFDKSANELCEEMKQLANNNYAIDNFESYLSRHFDVDKHTSTPNGLIRELKHFATITE